MTDTITELSELLHRLVRETVDQAMHDMRAGPPLSAPGDQDLVTIAEAARRLAVSRSTIYSLMGSGDLPYVHVGGKRGITIGDLGDFIAQHRASSPSDRQGHHG
jgi:excisionase family DNA binding protein